tara:strand:- start:182 stop:490 length:309 start_codon:yes stop_codon:yes gene_type:complete
MNWYKVIAEQGHQGSGRSLTRTLYLKASNVTKALVRYNNFPSLKKFRTKGKLKNKARVPTITHISKDELSELEKTIRNDPLVKNNVNFYFVDNEMSTFCKQQ